MMQAPTAHLGQNVNQQLQAPLTQSTGRKGNRIYILSVAQQPDRARMCGFGDKDRRPITPPPCVKLIVRDANTNRDIDINDINPQHFVLTVDLWDAEGQHEVNLVRHSSTSPSVSISMASTTSFPPPPETQMMMMHHGQPNPYGQMPMHMPPGSHHQDFYGGQPQMGYHNPYGPPGAMIPQPVPPQQGMYTRNLIGSVAVSASTLQDTNNEYGFWFVLQDLSVRTEGSFRLRLSFMDVGDSDGTLNASSFPIVAACFSDVFTVWSAKKFPGVKESTPLSKCFATQGVKIPIRKDGANRSGAGDDDGD